MANAYEFKDMATVNMVESVADTANVLIEEDGVIKRAPKSQVGGATSGGTGGAMILRATLTGNDEEITVTADEQYDFNEVLEALKNVMDVKLIIHDIHKSDGEPMDNYDIYVVDKYTNGYIRFTKFANNGGMLECNFYDDNSWYWWCD